MKINLFRNIRMQFLLKTFLSVILSALLTFIVMLIIGAFILFFGGEEFDFWVKNNHHYYILLAVLFIFATLLFAATTILVFYFLTKNTIDNIKNVSKIVQDISEGELGKTINVHDNDEVGILLKNINQMSVKLKELIEKDKKNELGKKDMLNNISHDLRTPMTTITGYLDIIINNKCTEAEKSEFLDIAYKKAVQLNALVNQLFEFSKIDSAIIELNKVPLNLVELVEQIVTGFVQPFRENDIEYSIMSDNTAIEVFIDADLMVRAFENIIGNAVKYGASGGKIDIEIAVKEGEAYVMISDYGDQIPIEESSKIFDKLYRLEKSKAQDGTGLGLTIAKSIIELNSGKINLEINGNKKSFIVILPINTYVSL